MKIRFPTQTQVFKLEKSLYGLRQAPLNWYTHLSTSLMKLGFEPIVTSQNTFVRKQESRAVMILV